MSKDGGQGAVSVEANVSGQAIKVEVPLDPPPSVGDLKAYIEREVRPHTNRAVTVRALQVSVEGSWEPLVDGKQLTHGRSVRATVAEGEPGPLQGALRHAKPSSEFKAEDMRWPSSSPMNDDARDRMTSFPAATPDVPHSTLSNERDRDSRMLASQPRQSHRTDGSTEDKPLIPSSGERLYTFTEPTGPLIRALSAEFVGSMGYVFLGLSLPLLQPQQHPSAVWAAAIGAFTLGFAPYSGAHFNPTVTVAMLLRGEIALWAAVLYLVVQIVGGIVGAGLLLGSLPGGELAMHRLSDTAPNRLGTVRLDANAEELSFSRGHGILAEGVSSFLLVSVVLSVAVGHKEEGKGLAEAARRKGINDFAGHKARSMLRMSRAEAGVAVTLVYYAVHSMLLPIDGASANPARSLASAIVGYHSNTGWSHLWIFIVSPLAGSVVASAVHWWMIDAVWSKKQMRGKPDGRAIITEPALHGSETPVKRITVAGQGKRVGFAVLPDITQGELRSTIEQIFGISSGYITDPHRNDCVVPLSYGALQDGEVYDLHQAGELAAPSVTGANALTPPRSPVEIRSTVDRRRRSSFTGGSPFTVSTLFASNAAVVASLTTAVTSSTREVPV